MPSTRSRRAVTRSSLPWHASPTVGLGLTILASLLTCVVAFNGPSLVVPQLGPRSSLLPSWYVPTGRSYLDGVTATALLWVAVLCGGLGLTLMLRALARGWRPVVARLAWLGALLHAATVLVPPVTSGDVLMYACYGRLQALGQDPYSITPADVFRSQYDPVLRWTERGFWHDTPSVYGPIASFTQVLASWLGGESMHDTLFWLQLINVVPLVLLGLLAVAIARRDHAAQARAVVLTLCNPLLIWAVAAGHHNEALGVVLAVLGLSMMRRSPFLAGAGIGLAGCVKVSLVFYGIAMAWAYRRQPRKLLGLCLGAAVPLLLCYGLWQPEALLAARRNTGYVSGGSVSWLLTGALGRVIGQRWAGWVVSALALVAMVVIANVLAQLLPWRSVPRLRRDEDPRQDPLTGAARTALVLSAAWLVTSPYTLSWYDLMVWVPLAVLAATPLDGIFVWRGTWLSLAYVLSRSPDDMGVLRPVSRSIYWACSFAQVATLVLIAWWWWLNRRRLKSERLVDTRAGSAAPPTRVSPSSTRTLSAFLWNAHASGRSMGADPRADECVAVVPQAADESGGKQGADPWRRR